MSEHFRLLLMINIEIVKIIEVHEDTMKVQEETLFG